MLMVGLLLTGCIPPNEQFLLPVQPPILLEDAIALVNLNGSRATGTLRAVGHVDGNVKKTNGGRASFNLDGILFYLPPNYVRFDMKMLGSRKFLLGSNDKNYWYYSAGDKQYHCDSHAVSQGRPDTLPITPNQVAEILGLVPIDIEWTHQSDLAPIQRITKDYQQVLFFRRVDGVRKLYKEYWLDRRPPRLIRRVVIRDDFGEVNWIAKLDNYRLPSALNPYLPYEISVHWPETNDTLGFHIKKWSMHTDLGPDAPQFVTPDECFTP